jgi:hypothetical protein
MLQQFSARPVRAFVIWEPVLVTDWTHPAAAALGRIPDPRAAQFWDKQRLISHAMGEHDRKSIVWDYIGIYPRGALRTDRPPEPLYHGRPVVEVIESAAAALAKALQ